MEADFPGSSQYTSNYWMRSRRVHAGCGGLGNGERLQTLPLTSPLYDSRFSDRLRASYPRSQGDLKVAKAGLQGAAGPLSEREVSSQKLFFPVFRVSPAATHEKQ